MSNILEGLNQPQIEAVTHKNGPILVVAGAGSGKTSALTHRIAYLIREHGISPWNILAVTFTNKAANEMKKRVTILLSTGNDQISPLTNEIEYRFNGENDAVGDIQIPTIGTFHSVCLRILRKHIHLMDFENSFAIYDTADQQILMKQIMESLMMDPKKVNPKAVLAHISNAKNQLLSADNYRSYASDYFSEKVAELYPRYQNALKRNNALDFDDIIMKTVELFEKYPDILLKYQEKFQYISVDEYQDTNKAQYVLIKMLAEKYRNICVIGDADQSIYSWRGATIQNILDFEKDYPETKVILLEQNYRSTQIILDASNTVIEKNSQRREKRLWTEKAGGEKIRHWLAINERHESELIAQEILKIVQDSEYPSYNNFVVLYRTNAQSRVIEECFIRYGIPYKIVGGIRFYDRKEIKDILAYLRVINNPSDSVSLIRIINTPSRKIGDKTIESLQNFATQNNLSLFNAMLLANDLTEVIGKRSASIESFVKIIKELQDLNKQNTASAMIKHVIELSGYKEMLSENTIENQARLENLAELISVSQKYDALESGISLSIFLEEVSLIADIDSMKEEDNSITLMTIHAAKGLEFPNVFIAGLEEGVFPHSRSLLDRSELEEERRLMYVAMTRAMDRLYLLNARQRMLYGESKANAPSQFLKEISPELLDKNHQTGNSTMSRPHQPIEEIGNKPVPIENLEGIDLELAVGDRIEHNIFGKGMVVDVKGGIVTIAFEDPRIGIKKLAMSIAPLKKL